MQGCVQSGNLPPELAHHYLARKSEEFQYEKVPVDYTMTKFKWEKKPIKPVHASIYSLKPPDAKKLAFQEKMAWFRNNLEKKRISWENGADWMKLERSNILMSSFIESRKVNMHKEVKI